MRKALIFILAAVTLMMVYGQRLPDITELARDMKAKFIGQDDASQDITDETHTRRPIRTRLRTSVPLGDGLEYETGEVEVDLYVTPMVAKLLSISNTDEDKDMGIDEGKDKGIDLKQTISRVFAALKKINGHVRNVLLLTAVLVPALMLSARRSRLSGLSRSLAGNCFSAAMTATIFAASLTAIAWLAFRYNIYSNLNGSFFLGPIALMVSSGACLRFYDKNDLIWNRMFLPLICMAVSAAITRII
jgi:hypothetical protein